MEGIVIRSEKPVDPNTKFRRVDMAKERSKCSVEAVLLGSDGGTSSYGVVVRYTHGKTTPRVVYKAVVEIEGHPSESDVEAHFARQVQEGVFDADIRNVIARTRINKRRSRSSRAKGKGKGRRSSGNREAARPEGAVL